MHGRLRPRIARRFQTGTDPRGYIFYSMRGISYMQGACAFDRLRSTDHTGTQSNMKSCLKAGISLIERNSTNAIGAITAAFLAGIFLRVDVISENRFARRYVLLFSSSIITLPTEYRCPSFQSLIYYRTVASVQNEVLYHRRRPFRWRRHCRAPASNLCIE
jgi:hypothetical protein